jgi:hypothetical protein
MDLDFGFWGGQLETGEDKSMEFKMVSVCEILWMLEGTETLSHPTRLQYTHYFVK